MTFEQEVVENKRLRQEIDAKIQEVKNLPTSRERSLTITKLQEAVMWLGMDLKRLGTTNPYPSSKDPSTGTTIEPTADGLEIMITQQHIDALRKYLGEENLRYFRHLKGLKGSVFPVLRLNFKRKHIPAYPVELREGMQIRNWMRTNFPEFINISQNKISKYAEELVEKAIID